MSSYKNIKDPDRLAKCGDQVLEQITGPNSAMFLAELHHEPPNNEVLAKLGIDAQVLATGVDVSDALTLNLGDKKSQNCALIWYAAAIGNKLKNVLHQSSEQSESIELKGSNIWRKYAHFFEITDFNNSKDGKKRLINLLDVDFDNFWDIEEGDKEGQNELSKLLFFLLENERFDDITKLLNDPSFVKNAFSSSKNEIFDAKNLTITIILDKIIEQNNPDEIKEILKSPAFLGKMPIIITKLYLAEKPELLEFYLTQNYFKEKMESDDEFRTYFLNKLNTSNFISDEQKIEIFEKLGLNIGKELLIGPFIRLLWTKLKNKFTN